MIFLDLKETYFGLCLFLTSKKFSVEWYFDLAAHDRREIIWILIQIESLPSDQYLTRMNIWHLEMVVHVTGIDDIVHFSMK